MKITILANQTQDGRVLYKATWKDGVNYVCVSRAFFEARMAKKGWKYD